MTIRHTATLIEVNWMGFVSFDVTREAPAQFDWHILLHILNLPLPPSWAVAAFKYIHAFLYSTFKTTHRNTCIYYASWFSIHIFSSRRTSNYTEPSLSISFNGQLITSSIQAHAHLDDEEQKGWHKLWISIERVVFIPDEMITCYSIGTCIQLFIALYITRAQLYTIHMSIFNVK